MLIFASLSTVVQLVEV